MEVFFYSFFLYYDSFTFLLYDDSFTFFPYYDSFDSFSKGFTLVGFLFCLFCKEFESIFRSSLFNSSPDFSLFFSIFHPQSFSLLSHTCTHGSVNCIFKHYQSIFFPSHIYFIEHIYRCERISQPVKPRFPSTCPLMKS